MKKNLLVLLLLALPAFAAPGPPPPANAVQAYQKATKVFVGTVVAVRKDRGGFDSLATVRCQRCLKGNLKGDVAVSGEGGGTEAARQFKVGEKLLFYLNDDLHADAWSQRVVSGAQLEKDLKELNK
jgi:hypothetical protein